MNIKKRLLSLFPKDMYYRFVDDVLDFSEDHVIGIYTFPKDAVYYQGHFPEYPVTPGSILMETAVQLGSVVLGKYMTYLEGKDITKYHVAIISSQIKFNQLVFPGDTVKVRCDKTSYKPSSGFLRSKFKMTNLKDELICKGRFTCKIANNEQLAK